MEQQESPKLDILSRTLACLFLAITAAVLLDLVMVFTGTECPVWLFLLCAGFVGVGAFLSRIPTPQLWKTFAGIALSCFLIVLITGLIWYSFFTDAPYQDVDSGKNRVYANRNVLVISPHEDDEINNLGGVLEEFVKYGSNVTVLFVTNGEYKDYGLQRIDEGIASVVSCGIPEENVLFLGYGNDWQGGTHIYNADSTEPMTSMYGYTATYGAAYHPPVYPECLYTRQNLTENMKSVILKIKPDLIFCTDYDIHEDHRAVSLLFERVMGQILSETEDYHPEVYKGFAYVTAYYSVDDYYTENMLSSVNAGGDQYLRNYSVYLWDDRVRFPVCGSSLSRSLYNCRVYQQTRLHMSQPIRFLAKAVINGDRVFWYRNTDSISYHASFFVSSGDAALLNDFMYLDSQNVLSNDSPFFGTWIPEEGDEERTITITLDAPTAVEQIRLYDAPSLDDNVLLAEVTVDGSEPIKVSLKEDGSATIVPVHMDQAQTITIRLIDTLGVNAGITEVEVFRELPEPESSFIKITNSYGDFSYDYHMNNEEETFFLYQYHCDRDTRYMVTSSSPACTAQISEDNVITVQCPEGQSCTLTVSSPDGTLSDSIVVSRTGWLCHAGQQIESCVSTHYEALRNTTTYAIANRVFHLFVKEHFTL